MFKKKMDKTLLVSCVFVLLVIEKSAAVNLGESCPNGDSDCTDTVAGSQCNTQTTQCECTPNKFQENPTTCTNKKALTVACTDGVENQCVDTNAECKANSEGTFQCLCKTTHFSNPENVCTAKIATDATCVATDKCVDVNGECRDDGTGALKCLCKSEFFKSSSGICQPKIAVSGACTQNVTDQCVDSNSECKSDINNAYTCSCKDGFFKKDTSCNQQIALDGTCEQSIENQCLDSNAACKADLLKCLCKDGFYKNNAGVCAAKISVDGTCDSNENTDQCLDSNSECKADANAATTCSCKDGFFKNGAGECKSKIALDGTCSALSDVCVDTEATCQTSDNTIKCLCKSTHYKNSNNQCMLKIENGAACVDGVLNQCKDTNADCSSAQCTCKDTYFTNTEDNKICTAKGGYSGTCVSVIGDSTCLYSLKCTTNKCQCSSPATQFFSTSVNACKEKIVLGGACEKEENKPCITTNAVCAADGEEMKCTCVATHYQKNDSCLQRLGHGDTCDKDGDKDQCIDNADCVKGNTDDYSCKCAEVVADGKCSGASLLTLSVFTILASTTIVLLVMR